jgi:hypothetical protein
LDEELRLGRGWIRIGRTRSYTTTISAHRRQCRRYTQRPCIAIIPNLYTSKPDGFIYNLGTHLGLPRIPIYNYYNLSVRCSDIPRVRFERAGPRGSWTRE